MYLVLQLFRWNGKFGPCYSILIKSRSLKIAFQPIENRFSKTGIFPLHVCFIFSQTTSWTIQEIMGKVLIWIVEMTASYHKVSKRRFNIALKEIILFLVIESYIYCCLIIQLRLINRNVSGQVVLLLLMWYSFCLITCFLTQPSLE